MEIEKHQEHLEQEGSCSPDGASGEEDSLTEVSDLDLHIEELDQQVELLAKGNNELENERDILTAEKVGFAPLTSHNYVDRCSRVLLPASLNTRDVLLLSF